jgi:general secretion pathway protein J
MCGSLRTAAPHGAAGFTLIELLVALSVFAVLSVMAYGGLSGALGARERVLQSLERTTALQKAYLRLRNDLQQLRARPSRDPYGETQAALVLLPDGSMEFTRSGWRNPLAQPRPTLQRVAYRLDADGRLLRSSWRAVDRAQGAPVSEAVVLSEVEDLRWRFLSRAELDHGGSHDAWYEVWPPPATHESARLTAVPRAVEVALTLKDLGEVRLLFSASNEAPK